MVRLTKIYTKSGDKGETSLGNGARVAKHDPRVAAYGDVDETNATLGLARLSLDGALDDLLAKIQNDLFDLGADLCCPQGEDEEPGSALRVTEDYVTRLETEIDRLNATLEPLNSFVLPGGSAAAAALHLSRAVSRRAERKCTTLAEVEPVSPWVIQYLNRLSDLLFVMARVANDQGRADVLWRPGG